MPVHVFFLGGRCVGTPLNLIVGAHGARRRRYLSGYGRRRCQHQVVHLRRVQISRPYRAIIGRCASGYGAVRELVRNAWWSRFPRNVALRCGRMGRGIMTACEHPGEGRVMRSGRHVAAGCVTNVRSGQVECLFTAMRPNPAFERTCRFMFAFWAGVVAARRST